MSYLPRRGSTPRTPHDRPRNLAGTRRWTQPRATRRTYLRGWELHHVFDSRERDQDSTRAGAPGHATVLEITRGTAAHPLIV